MVCQSLNEDKVTLVSLGCALGQHQNDLSAEQSVVWAAQPEGNLGKATQLTQGAIWGEFSRKGSRSHRIRVIKSLKCGGCCKGWLQYFDASY